jgi:hypothetical protein
MKAFNNKPSIFFTYVIVLFLNGVKGKFFIIRKRC